MDEAVLALLGRIVAYGGAAAALAYGVFVFLGRKWIERTFERGLADYRHAQAKDIEEVRFKINSLFSRLTKIHEKEAEVLPEAWGKLNDTVALLMNFVSPLQEYPDLDRMSTAQLEELLKRSSLYDFEKDELRGTSKKLDYYKDRIFWHNSNAVRRSFREFHVYIQKHRIFLNPDLKEEFTKVDDLMWSALVDREMGHEPGERKVWITAWSKLRAEVKPSMTRIEELVQRRLHHDKA